MPSNFKFPEQLYVGAEVCDCGECDCGDTGYSADVSASGVVGFDEVAVYRFVKKVRVEVKVGDDLSEPLNLDKKVK